MTRVALVEERPAHSVTDTLKNALDCFLAIEKLVSRPMPRPRNFHAGGATPDADEDLLGDVLVDGRVGA